MGLFSTRPHSQRHSSTSFSPRSIVLFAFCCFALLFLFEVDNFARRTKTIVGHNLEPTPWHIFPSKSFDEESTYSRATKIIQCSYFSCGKDPPSANKKTSVRRTKNLKLDDDQKGRQSGVKCPDFFKHIHKDLDPWAESKITEAHIMEAQKLAAFRVVIVGGKLFVEFYYACVQSRAMFTLWGFLQLLRRYPDQLPDVDLMFDCMDKPTINRTEHAAMPLPLFRYCTTSEHFDIPFPDWSFWGWSEINIAPWDEQFKSIKRGSKRRSWANKEPIAYWRGNPDVASPIRLALLECNDTNLWKAQILRQDWVEAARGGFQDSKLSKQCNHRYKIYAEGYAWSVSLKYILACGSFPLIISPQYEDFFSRGLVPNKNYWPIPLLEMCEAIKSAVDWGNSHPAEAEAIGKAAQDLMGSLSMDRVYDYMYHLLREYSKLQAFRPVRPSSALEVCVESVMCFADENQRRWLQKSTTFPTAAPPCSLPPPESSSH